jgi:hypothetical protein
MARFDVHGGVIGTLEQLVKVDSMAGLLRGRVRCLGGRFETGRQGPRSVCCG